MLDQYEEGNQIVSRAIFATPHTLCSTVKDSANVLARDVTGFANGNAVVVFGAAPLAGHLFTTITAIVGNTITLAAAPAQTLRETELGRLATPGVVTFTARKADGTPTPYVVGTAPEATLVSVGIYELRLVNDEGDWLVDVQGTTPAYGADNDGYRIRRSRARA